VSNYLHSVSLLLLHTVWANDKDDNVRSQSSSEMDLLAEVAKACGRPIKDLDKIWRQPSFSIANITTSSDQDLKVIVAGLKRHCQETFDELKSANTFEVS
jgi:di- and tripeptidase